MNSTGSGPEGCFDAGHIGLLRPPIDIRPCRLRSQFSLIMGVLGGIPGTTRHLVDQVDSLPQGSHWQVIESGRISGPWWQLRYRWAGTCRSSWRTTFTWKRAM